NLRFLNAAVPPLAVCIATGLGRYDRKLLAVVCAASVLLAARLALTGMDVKLATAARVAFGSTSKEAFLKEGVLDYPIVQFANSRLPQQSVILTSALAHDTALYRARTLIADYWTQDSIHYDSDT